METTKADTAEEEAEADVAEATADPANPIRQSARTAARSAKFLSSRQREGLFTAGTASRSIANTEAICETAGASLLDRKY